MIVLHENPALRYLSAVFDDEDVEAFRNRLAKIGSLIGRPVRLSDGRKVGQVIGGGAWPNTFTTEDGEHFEGAPIIEMIFDSADFMKAAKRADLTLEDEAVVLLGSSAGDRPGSPVKKSARDALRDELRAAWGLP
jgi:hypothetical protein